MLPLDGTRVVSVAVNLPGPATAARLARLGASVVKVESPRGDPLAAARPAWYRDLHAGVQVVRLDLKAPADCDRLAGWLAEADLLLTALRPAALARHSLGWDSLHERYPRLCMVEITGQPAPDEDRPGHDLTYQALAGLVEPPTLPRTLVADLAGALEATNAALALLLARDRGQGAGCVHVSLAQAAMRFADPVRHALTGPGDLLGGGFPGYQVYRARTGWVAVAALEPHFLERLAKELGLAACTRDELIHAFRTRHAIEWEPWAIERDLPIVAVRERVPD